MASDYQRPPLLFSAHLETIFPALLRSVDHVFYQRERITTNDNDFLDLDWLRQDSDRLVIISHGLEGNSSRAYVKGMARTLFANGFDALAWNFRGCSEEMNLQLRFYHSGATEDLHRIVAHAIQLGYRKIYLVGFSLGGNLTLKYLGERKISPHIRKAVVFSAPVNLYSSCLSLSKLSNWVYANRFLKSLKGKVVQKSRMMPGLDIRGIEKIHTLIQFDDQFTAPLHGFRNAMDYYEKCSSINFIHAVETPTLLVNARNDPFLGEECYPNVAAISERVTIEYPKFGGHVGFAQFNKNGLYWSEERALSFLTE